MTGLSWRVTSAVLLEKIKLEIPREPRRVRDEVQTDLDVMFLLLGGLSLVVGAIGIANITLVGVMERTGEIVACAELSEQHAGTSPHSFYSKAVRSASSEESLARAWAFSPWRPYPPIRSGVRCWIPQYLFWRLWSAVESDCSRVPTRRCARPTWNRLTHFEIEAGQDPNAIEPSSRQRTSNENVPAYCYGCRFTRARVIGSNS